jgi:hypothetical protein
MSERRRNQRRRRNQKKSSELCNDDRRNAERRRHERVAAEIMVEVATRGQRTYRRTGNISLGGLGFHAPIPFKQGSRVEMTLRLAGRGGAVPVSGVVVGIDETGRGTRVKFVELSTRARTLLIDHLKLFDMPTETGASPLRRQQIETASSQVREGLLIFQKLGLEFRLRSTDKVVGRDPKGADLVVDHPTVSRRHAHIYLQNDRHVISDLSSTNGIHFRHKQIHSLVLKDGMFFKIGKLEVQYLATRVV